MVSDKFSFGKQDFKYFIVYKNNKESRPLCILFSVISICKIYSDKTKWMNFLIKDEKKINKYIIIWEKVSNKINKIKKINSKLTYNKKFQKAEKECDTKDSFQCFHMPAIFFDSVYTKYKNYFQKVFLEKFIHNFFWKNIVYFRRS